MSQILSLQGLETEAVAGPDTWTIVTSHMSSMWHAQFEQSIVEEGTH